MCFESISDNVKADRKRQDQKFPIISEEVWRCATPRDHPYITSGKGLGEGVRKMAIFADVQCYLC